jgi:hypothetical protein
MGKGATTAGPLGLALAMCLSPAGCGGPGPSKVARRFLAAVEKGDAESVGKYATQETVRTVGTFSEKAKGGVAAKGGVVSAEEAVSGGAAVVTVKFKDGSTEKVDLVKVGGKWKVSIKK